MGNLVRTSSGYLNLDDSITLSALQGFIADNRVHEVLKPCEEVLPYHKVYADMSVERLVINGNPVLAERCSETVDGLVLLMLGAKAAGIYCRSENWYKPKVMLL
jgi:tRNA U55 pseudouridine synthase TruB